MIAAKTIPKKNNPHQNYSLNTIFARYNSSSEVWVENSYELHISWGVGCTELEKPREQTFKKPGLYKGDQKQWRKSEGERV